MASATATLEGIRKHLTAASNIIQPVPHPPSPSKKNLKKQRGKAGGEEAEQVQQQPGRSAKTWNLVHWQMRWLR